MTHDTAKPPLKNSVYEKEMARLQRELVKLQEWVKHERLKVCVLCEGRDAAGKGATSKRSAERANPRVARVAALDKPADRERSERCFQRCAELLRAGGETTH